MVAVRGGKITLVGLATIALVFGGWRFFATRDRLRSQLTSEEQRERVVGVLTKILSLEASLSDLKETPIHSMGIGAPPTLLVEDRHIYRASFSSETAFSGDIEYDAESDLVRIGLLIRSWKMSSQDVKDSVAFSLFERTVRYLGNTPDEYIRILQPNYGSETSITSTDYIWVKTDGVAPFHSYPIYIPSFLLTADIADFSLVNGVAVHIGGPRNNGFYTVQISGRDLSPPLEIPSGSIDETTATQVAETKIPEATDLARRSCPHNTDNYRLGHPSRSMVLKRGGDSLEFMDAFSFPLIPSEDVAVNDVIGFIHVGVADPTSVRIEIPRCM